MSTIIDWLKSNKSILIPFILSLVFLIIFLLISSTRAPVLKITAAPEGASIFVDNLPAVENTFEQKLSPGIHQILVTKENYYPQEKEIDLSSHTTIDIVLLPVIKEEDFTSLPIEIVPPHAATELSAEKDNVVIAIDRRDSLLKKITRDDISTLHPEPIRSYSFFSPLVALIERDDTGKIIIINTKEGESRTISAPDLDQIISVTISYDLSGIYILGNYDPATRYSKLFFSSLDDFSPIEITTTKADTVESLAERKILFFETVDGLDRSKISIFSLENNKVIFTTNGNHYLISPNRNRVAIQSSDSLTILNIENLSKKRKSIPSSYKLAWRDNLTMLMLNNLLPGVEISYLEVSSLNTTPFIPIESLRRKSIRFISGVAGNSLFAIDTEGKLVRINLP